MPEPAGSIRQALRILAENGSMLRTKQALALGIHPRTLYALRDAGSVIRVGRGIYRLADAEPLTNPDWAVVASKVPRAVICLVSALSHHGLTTQIPHEIDIALPSHAAIPTVDNLPVRVFWFSDAAFNAGVQKLQMNGVPTQIYSPEKTIADCFKYRNKIGLNIATEALRMYRRETAKPKMQAVLKFAEICRVERVIRPYLEAVI